MWQKREKHHNDIQNLSEKDGVFRDKTGFIYKWEGKKVQEALKAKGHSSLDFKICVCSK